jgi:ABC-type sugar transport system permease subunit
MGSRTHTPSRPARSGFDQRASTLRARRRAWLFAYALLAPSLLIILAVNLYPILYAAYISVLQYSMLSPTRAFVGLRNYANLFSDSEFLQSLVRTVYFVVVSISMQLVIGLFVALVLNERFWGRGWVRAIILIPWAIPTIVNGALWRWIYQPNFGALNGLLSELGLIDNYVQWLARPWLAMNMVIIADAWHMVPFYVLLFLAALQGIPDILYESAKIDGASWLRQVWSITLPLLKPMILVVLVVRTIETFRVFDIIYALTRGGPGGGTTVIGYFAYQETFGFLNFGMGAAVAMVITFSVLILAVLYVRLLHHEEPLS